jgi:hypothetical protein
MLHQVHLELLKIQKIPKILMFHLNHLFQKYHLILKIHLIQKYH